MKIWTLDNENTASTFDYLGKGIFEEEKTKERQHVSYFFDKEIYVGNEMFHPCPSYPGIWCNWRTGKYVSQRNLVPRDGTPQYNRKGYPLQMCVCIGRRRAGKYTLATSTVNQGRLVLDSASVVPLEGQTEVDHVNRNPFDNRLVNLRFVTHTENIRNRRHVMPVWLHTPEVKRLAAIGRRKAVKK